MMSEACTIAPKATYICHSLSLSLLEFFDRTTENWMFAIVKKNVSAAISVHKRGCVGAPDNQTYKAHRRMEMTGANKWWILESNITTAESAPDEKLSLSLSCFRSSAVLCVRPKKTHLFCDTLLFCFIQLCIKGCYIGGVFCVLLYDNFLYACYVNVLLYCIRYIRLYTSITKYR